MFSGLLLPLWKLSSNNIYANYSQESSVLKAFRFLIFRSLTPKVLSCRRVRCQRSLLFCFLSPDSDDGGAVLARWFSSEFAVCWPALPKCLQQYRYVGTQTSWKVLRRCSSAVHADCIWKGESGWISTRQNRTYLTSENITLWSFADGRVLFIDVVKLPTAAPMYVTSDGFALSECTLWQIILSRMLYVVKI